MHQPVTTDPFTIMLINMTIVVAVLYGLSWIIRLIRYIDPTRQKQADVKPAPVIQTAPPAPAVATPPVTALPAAIPAPTPPVEDDLEVTAVIAAALAAYGYSFSQIVAVRRAGEQSWTRAARMEGVNTGIK